MTDLDYLKKYLPKDKLEEGIDKLKKGVPVQYIVGNVDFYNVNLLVNENVLIPRFETELLVEKIVNYCKKYFNKKIDILDLATGSGAIGITLKKNLDCNVIGSDISKNALEVASLNALRNDADVKFIASDLFENIKGKFDVLISNPPYVSKDEKIDEIVKNNEPHIALYADDCGLYFYKKIFEKANLYLNDKFIIAFEIGVNQGEAVSNLGHKYFPNSKVEVEKDLTGRDRFVFIFQNLI